MEPFPPGPPPPAAAGIPKEQTKPSAKRSKTEKMGKLKLGAQEPQAVAALKNKYISQTLANRVPKEIRRGNEYQMENVDPRLELQNGIMKTKEGRVFYGTFRDYVPHGRGLLERPIGPEVGYIEGEWNEGKLCGPVTIYSSIGHIFSGFWENDHWLENKAVVKFKNGDVYEGTFSKEPEKQLEKEGRGILKTKNKLYQGIWKNDKFSEGKITFLNDPELKEYEGQVKSDAFSGKGVLTYKDGRRIEGNFINGHCLEGKYSRILENGNVVDEYVGKLTHHLPPHLEPPPQAPGLHGEPKKRKKSATVVPIPRQNPAPTPKQNSAPAPKQNPAPQPKAPTLPPLTEIVRTIPGYRVNGHYEDARIVYDGELANNQFDGMGILQFKNRTMLEDLGIPDAPRFAGFFRGGMAMEGLGVQEIILPDGKPRISYGMFKEGRLHTGVGFVVTEQGIYCGVFQEGRHIKGRAFPFNSALPSTQMVFLEFLMEAIATYRQLNQQ